MTKFDYHFDVVNFRSSIVRYNYVYRCSCVCEFVNGLRCLGIYFFVFIFFNVNVLSLPLPCLPETRAHNLCTLGKDKNVRDLNGPLVRYVADAQKACPQKINNK